MKDRLQKLLTTEGLAPTKFAEVIGVQRSSISHILSGRNKPSFDVIQTILEKFPKLNPDWLLMGKGEMYRRVIQTSLFDEVRPIMGSTPNQISEKEMVNDLVNNQNKTKPSENRLSVKVIERIVVFFNDKTFKEYNPE
jgi:transcriptional regulator with XRE-family HTH domain